MRLSIRFFPRQRRLGRSVLSISVRCYGRQIIPAETSSANILFHRPIGDSI